jgi:peptide/nickel transport system permease protein
VARFLLRRLLLIPLALVFVNFISFAYAHVALRYQQSQNPWGSATAGEQIPVLSLYAEYARGLLHGDFGAMPVAAHAPVAEAVAQAASKSLGLLGLAFGVSLLLGVGVGLWAVKIEPARIAPWLVPVSAVGLALPSFYIGILLVAALVLAVLRAGPEAHSPLPLSGFGWDVHLILPALALLVRPTAQIAQVTAGLLSGELNRQYIVAARSRGNTWARARWKHALQNVLAPVVLAVAGSFRLLVGEQILVEWLFIWPGLGQLLALALVPSRLAGPGGAINTAAYFLHPPLVAALLTVFAALFLILDAAASLAARWADPRLRASDGGAK